MPSAITEHDARYAYNVVEKICTEVGPGLPGSPQEHARAKIIQQEMESSLSTGNVTTEAFTMAPKALLEWLPVGAILILISALLNISIHRFGGFFPWISTSVALVLSVLTNLAGVLEFVFYYEFVEPVFSKKESVNVIGSLRKPGTDKIKRLLILGGHHDSAMEMTWLRFLGYGYYIVVFTLFTGFATMMVFSIMQFAGLVTAHAGLVRIGTIGLIPLAYPVIPSIVFALFFNRGKQGGGVVPGATDNLSASALAVSLCRFLKDNPSYIPDDTEIRFISFGSEEAGLRGSRKYVERHLDELKRLDARLLNFETVAYPEITILTSDVNGTVKHSSDMIKGVAAAAQRAGVPHTVKPFPFGGGGTDAGPFSQAGLKALTILPFKVPQQMVAFYHQRWDTPDKLSIEPLLNVLKLALEWVRSGGE